MKIKNDPEAKKVVFGNSKIKMVLDYNQKANIGSVAYAYPLAKLLLMVISQTGNVIV